MEQEKKQNLQLESEVFGNEQEKQKLSEWVGMNTNFVVKYIDRKDLNKDHSDNILEKNGKDYKEITGYNLYLPHDLKIKEIPKVVEQINQHTFGNAIPEYASLKEIEKYIREYKKYFPECKFEYFTQFEDKIHQIEISKCEATSNYIQKIQAEELKERETDFMNIENKLVKKLQDQFHQVFLEEGMKNLVDNMNIFTQQDLEHFSPEEKKRIDTETKHVYENEKKLREVINIETLKQELESARKTNNKEKINKTEIKILSQISYEINKFPYFQINVIGGKTTPSDPMSLIEEKKLICVGKTLISSAFLRGLGIEHSMLDIPLHAALLVTTSNKDTYYFDPTNSKNIIKIDKTGKIGDYNIINLVSKDKSLDTLVKYRVMPDIEQYGRFMILSSIISKDYNIGKKYIKNGEIEKGLSYVNKSIEAHKSLLSEGYKTSNALQNIGVMTSQKGQAFKEIKPIGETNNIFKEAIGYFKKALELDPSDIKAHLDIANTIGSIIESLANNFIDEYEGKILAYKKEYDYHMKEIFKYDYKRTLEYQSTGEILESSHVANKALTDEITGNLYIYKWKNTQNKVYLDKALSYYKESLLAINYILKEFKNIPNQKEIERYKKTISKKIENISK